MSTTSIEKGTGLFILYIFYMYFKVSKLLKQIRDKNLLNVFLKGEYTGLFVKFDYTVFFKKELQGGVNCVALNITAHKQT